MFNFDLSHRLNKIGHINKFQIKFQFKIYQTTNQNPIVIMSISHSISF